MGHTCDSCGNEFDTLTRLRLHECSRNKSGKANTNNGGRNRISNLIGQIRAGATDLVPEVLAEYERQLQEAHTADGDADPYSDLIQRYNKPLMNTVDSAVQSEGWDLLENMLDVYEPGSHTKPPHVTPILENTVSRFIIRKRVKTSILVVPNRALTFLHSIIRDTDEGYDTIRDGTHCYGWGVGHPKHSVSNTLHELLSEDPFFVNPILEHAFYADQYEAISILESLVDEVPTDQRIEFPRRDVRVVECLLDAAASAQNQDYTPPIPRYWEWSTELEYEFEMDPEIRNRVRMLVNELGIANELRTDWELADLEL